MLPETFIADSLDDLMIAVYPKILENGLRISSTKKESREIIGATLVLTNPRARLSFSEDRSALYSCLGDLFWYLAGSNKLAHIRHYIPRFYDEASDDGLTLRGAYGPRIFSGSAAVSDNQFFRIAKLLREKENSRQMVISIFNESDTREKTNDVPCTCLFQFFKREGRLDMIVYMRSNDAFRGIPHDVFCFTMIQEIMARCIGVEIGNYIHKVGSLHIYEKEVERAKQYLSEGFQKLSSMPPMPIGDQWNWLPTVLNYEERIRLSKDVIEAPNTLPEYWREIIKFLAAYQQMRLRKFDIVQSLIKSISTDDYRNILNEKILKKLQDTGHAK